MPLSLIYVGYLLLGKVCIPSETPMEKTNVSFVSGYQLEVACGWGFVVTSLSVLGPHPAHTCVCFHSL